MKKRVKQKLFNFFCVGLALLGLQSCTNPTTPTIPAEQAEVIPVNSLKLADREGFYGIYSSEQQWSGCPVKTTNTKRFKSGSYLKFLTVAEKAKIGQKIDFRIVLYGAYDQWDRNAYSWYIKVPKGTATLANVNPDNYNKISFIHYTTPYFTHNSNPNQITYTRDISDFSQDLKDPNFDVYIGYEVAANPVNKSSGGFLNDGWEANYCSYPGFNADIFIDTKAESKVSTAVTKEIISVYSSEIKNAEFVDAAFTTKNKLKNAYLRISTSGHGEGNLEEGMYREFAFTLNNNVLGKFSSQQICTPPEYYDGINPYGAKCAGCTWRYPYRNWCQGGEIVVRTVPVGDLVNGNHNLKIDVGLVLSRDLNQRKPVTANNYLQTYVALIGDIAN